MVPISKGVPIMEVTCHECIADLESMLGQAWDDKAENRSKRKEREYPTEPSLSWPGPGSFMITLSCRRERVMQNPGLRAEKQRKAAVKAESFVQPGG